MSHRIEQVNQLLKKEISGAMVTEIELPADLLITVTKVVTSRDLRHAKVLITVLPEGKTGTAFDKLKSQIGIVQHYLNEKLSLKPLPRIRFVLDSQEKHAADIEALLDRIKEKE